MLKRGNFDDCSFNEYYAVIYKSLILNTSITPYDQQRSNIVRQRSGFVQFWTILRN
jgi:hypothetical protein